MAKRNRSAAVHIPLEHQSSPKETENDKIIRNAADDIRSGKFQPEVTDEFFDVGMSALLAQHPNVQEAISKLEYAQVPKTNAEYLEKAEMLHEANVQLSAYAKWEGQGRWEGKYNEEIRTVNPMTPTTFIEKLKAIGISAEAEPPEVTVSIENPDYAPEYIATKYDERTGAISEGYYMDPLGRPSHVDMRIVKSDKQIYLGNRVIQGRVALNAKVWDEKLFKLVDMRINTLQVPLGPEWTVMRFDEYGIPTNEKFHGWRTALLSLITHRVITKEQADKAFGEAKGEASLFYRKQLFEGGY
jgi:hypothetical protein